ncbi:MAG: mechanosensitive ion channel [Bacteroidia bacterium]|jgi:small-conductance mechanosensitive channel|nr:mechanosensitive ion channel [Bacteroidota bacterium]MBP6512415.1 mechanosensitive ion channel [Bacteroidia bacterium]MBP7244296.1 mechanosensitive ion channel [Bacteroidia bacterium]
MEAFNLQIIETIIILSLYIILYFVFKKIINNFLKKTRLERGRRKMAIRAVQVFTTLTAIILLTGVWGFKQNEIALFASSILTAVGIAFFAQWSLLSNITSSILIFFNHPIKLGDSIKVLHKDFQYEGTIIELNYFFVHLKTENNEIITIPNSHFFDKSFSISEPKENLNQTT